MRLSHPAGWRVVAAGLASVAVVAFAALVSRAAPARVRQEARPAQRTFTVVLKKYAIEPPVLEVDQDDLVKITLVTRDIPHSFTIDEYRIAKRAVPDRTVTFEFRADRPGRFPIYCSLRQDERCRDMKAELVVHGE